MLSIGGGQSGSRSPEGELRMLATSAAAVWGLVPNPARYALGVAAVIMAMAAWINAQIPVALGDLANSISSAQSGAKHWQLRDAKGFLFLLASMFLLREVLNVARKYLVHKTTTNLDKKIMVDVFSNLMRADIASLSQDRVGALHGRLRRSAEGFTRFVMLCFMDFLPSILIAVFAFSVALERRMLLGLVMLGVVPAASYIVVRQIRSQKGVRLELLRCKESVDAAVVEQLSGIETVRAANTHDREVGRVAQVCEGVRSRELRHHVQMSLFDFLKALNESTFFIIVVALSIALVAKGAFPAGEIITFSMLFASILMPLREIHRIVDEAHESALKVRDLLDLLAEPHDSSFIVIEPGEPTLDGSVPAIELCDVTLDYRTAGGSVRKGLSRVSLCVPTGNVVGVAGYSGSGKSTWLRALLRLAHPSSGQILVGGVPIEKLSRETLARLVGYVSQSPFLFAGTVGENIAYGCENVTEERLVMAAEAADLMKDIRLMPGGFEATVLEGGRNLAGGQRQRIAIARVFLKAPPIVVLDEATSALDNSTERRVLEALSRRLKGHTVIMVAHRLSTLRGALRLYIFNEGEIAQTGTFDELSESPGIFSELLKNAGIGSGEDQGGAESSEVLLEELQAVGQVRR